MMPHIHVERDTSISMAAIVRALTDFGPNRLDIFPNLAPRFYKVHEVGPLFADVTEGSDFAGGVWERAKYSWGSDMVRVDVTESNTFAPGSTWIYQLRPLRKGTRVVLDINRIPRTFKSRLLSIPLTLFGSKIFGGDLEKTLAWVAGQTSVRR
jgi:hypothetical protein